MRNPTNYGRTRRARLASIFLAAALGAATQAKAQNSQEADPLLDLFVKKGFVTQDEANQIKAEADEMRTNGPVTSSRSKWILSDAVKDVELFGDLRLRYEQREADGTGGAKVELNRQRYAVRLGVRGDLFDQFYYGVRLDTAGNPRSPWVTFGTSSSGVPYNGPYGKSTAGINVDQVYMGWRPEPWVDITVGRMPMPLYTTPMVWDSDYNPEGAAEHLKYSVGDADLFANFGQFLYQDTNPNFATPNLGFAGTGSSAYASSDNLFQLAYQAGFTYHIRTNLTAKVAATAYQYIGKTAGVSPYFGNTFVGEGSYAGPGTINGSSGYGTITGPPYPYPTYGFANNQVGLDHLTIVEVPFEINLHQPRYDTRLFGDFAYNLDGKARAEEAAAGYAYYVAQNPQSGDFKTFSPQTHDVKAYQIGIAFASTNNLGMVYGTSSVRHGWEVRSYWQHVEQYALDPNLLDSDFFEGRGNLEGFYIAGAFGLTANVIGTVRYGYATRINDQIGTGGSNQDIPQVNPIRRYQILQLDLTMRF